MAKATQQDSNTTTEYQVWYDAVDGVRRSANAVDKDAVQQIIVGIHEDEARRQLLAASVGLGVEPHQHNITITEVTTTTKPVQL